MILYLLISVSCLIKEPSKTFSLNCKPQVEQFFLEESECKALMKPASTCIVVKVK